MQKKEKRNTGEEDEGRTILVAHTNSHQTVKIIIAPRTNN